MIYNHMKKENGGMSFLSTGTYGYIISWKENAGCLFSLHFWNSGKFYDDPEFLIDEPSAPARLGSRISASCILNAKITRWPYLSVLVRTKRRARWF